MEQPADQTWRGFLQRYLLLHPEEKEALVNALNVNYRTLEGWLTQEGRMPRSPNLMFPIMVRTLGTRNDRETLTSLILQDFPKLAPVFNDEDAVISPEIPPETYEMVLKALTDSSAITALPTVLSLIVNGLARHLDSNQQGLAVFVVKCIVPPARQRVQGLTILKSHQTRFWRAEPITVDPIFLGRESVVGTVIGSAQPIIIDNISVPSVLSYYPCPISSGSLAAYPIHKQGTVSACMLLISEYTGFFTEIRRGLLEKYVQMAVLAFRDKDFFLPEDIDLQVYPPAHIQLSYLLKFNERVLTYLSLHPNADRTVAELTVLREMIPEDREHQ